MEKMYFKQNSFDFNDFCISKLRVEMFFHAD